MKMGRTLGLRSMFLSSSMVPVTFTDLEQRPLNFNFNASVSNIIQHLSEGLRNSSGLRNKSKIFKTH